MRLRRHGAPCASGEKGLLLSSYPTRPSGPAANASRRQRSPLRWVALIALAAAIVALVVTLLGGGGREYRIMFDSAGQLVPGDIVRIGGARAGEVTSVDLSSDNQAEVRVTMDADRPPLHEGTTAAIRWQGLVGVASRYVDVSPAPDFKPELADGAVLGADKNRSIVEVDQVINALDPDTRKGLQEVIKGSGAWYKGREEQASRSAKYFGPALEQFRKVSAEITRDDQVFQDFLVDAGDAMGAIAERSEDLTSAVGATRQAERALSSDTTSLRTALDELPVALRQGSDAMVELRPALGDLTRLVDATGEGTKELTPFLKQLRPVLDEAVPTFGQLRQMIDSPGEADDALDALRDLPALGQLTKTTFPHAEKALGDSTPIFQFVRPYVPDLVSWVRSFGGAMATYDANGHYARTVAVFDAFKLVDDANGGTLVPKPPSERNRGEGLSTGNLRRCPGTATRLPADGSAPFVDSGDQANADCDPKQTIGGTR